MKYRSYYKYLLHLNAAITTGLRMASWPKEGSDPCQHGYLHVKLKDRTAHDLIVVEYIRRENFVVKKVLLVTSFKEIERFNRNFHCCKLEMAAELVFVYAVLKPADGKKDEVEAKL